MKNIDDMDYEELFVLCYEWTIVIRLVLLIEHLKSMLRIV